VTGTAENKTALLLGAGHGLAVRRSYVSATDTDCGQNGGAGLNAGVGAVVAFTNSRANANIGSGVVASGAIVDANGLIANNNGVYGIYAEAGGRVTARSANVGGSGSQSVRASNGSQINISESSVRKSTTDGTSDIVATGGSIIHAVGATGGTNTAVNTPSANGLIFK